MSSNARAALVFVRILLVAALAFEFAATHFPTPSGVPDEDAEDVRGAWSTVGAIGRAGAAFVPDFVGDLIAPIADDKTIHVLLFLPLGLLFAFERRLLRRLDARSAAIVFGALAVYAGLGEAAQGLFGRIPEFGDWIANCVGAGVGVGVVYLITRSRAAPAASPASRAS